MRFVARTAAPKQSGLHASVAADCQVHPESSMKLENEVKVSLVTFVKINTYHKLFLAGVPQSRPLVKEQPAGHGLHHTAESFARGQRRTRGLHYSRHQ